MKKEYIKPKINERNVSVKNYILGLSYSSGTTEPEGRSISLDESPWDNSMSKDRNMSIVDEW